MIHWLPSVELRLHLRAYPPIGMWLRGWFHAVTPEDPRATIPSPPEHHVDEGLGEVVSWCGTVDDVPFALRSMAGPRGGFGLELLLPVLLNGDRAHLEVLGEICAHLPPWHGPYFDQIPRGTSFGVAGAIADAPVYRSVLRDDAAAVASFLGPPYRVVELPPGPPQWLVVGPPAGPFVSRLETFASEEDARRQAARWADETGAAFDVRAAP